MQQIVSIERPSRVIAFDNIAELQQRRAGMAGQDACAFHGMAVINHGFADVMVKRRKEKLEGPLVGGGIERKHLSQRCLIADRLVILLGIAGLVQKFFNIID